MWFRSCILFYFYMRVKNKFQRDSNRCIHERMWLPCLPMIWTCLCVSLVRAICHMPSSSQCEPHNKPDNRQCVSSINYFNTRAYWKAFVYSFCREREREREKLVTHLLWKLRQFIGILCKSISNVRLRLCFTIIIIQIQTAKVCNCHACIYEGGKGFYNCNCLKAAVFPQ